MTKPERNWPGIYAATQSHADPRWRGWRHGWFGTPTYTSWSGAKARCRNPKDASYARYGGAGIRFSERWDDFVDFLRDMGERPPGTSIDRIDPHGNYEPGNCRWATRHEQRHNAARLSVEHNGQRVRLTDLADATGVRYQILFHRIFRQGWPVDRAISQPVRHQGPRRKDAR